MIQDWEKQEYPQLGETLYRKTLPNGLQVVLLPKPDYHETIGVMAAKFGALDRVFKPKNRKRLQEFPLGIAHFLEHRLFEMKQGQDAMQVFAQQGAESNAFTGYQQTVYYFSASDRILDNLSLLQSFTGLSTFTEEGVAREQAIIAQEIDMYQDDPDYRLYAAILGQLYPETPLAEDIAGSRASIEKITAARLKTNFDIFYQPSNMLLFLAGRFDPEAAAKAIEDQQSKGRQKKVQPIVRGDMPHLPVLPSASEEMLVAGPKLAVGIRGENRLVLETSLHDRLALRLLFAMMLGWTSATYQDWYQSGKIDDSFSVDVEVTDAFRFAVLTLDSSEPLAMSRRIRRLLQRFEQLEDLNEEQLTLVKNELYGDFLKSINNLEYVGTQYAAFWTAGENLFDLPAVLDSLNLSAVLAVGRAFMEGADVTDFIIFPK